MNACVHSLSFSGMAHQDWRSVAESGSIAKWMEGAGEVLVYITKCGGRSACRPILMVSFWFSGMSSHAETTSLATASAWSLPFMFSCPLILCSIVVNPHSAP